MSAEIIPFPKAGDRSFDSYAASVNDIWLTAAEHAARWGISNFPNDYKNADEKMRCAITLQITIRMLENAADRLRNTASRISRG